MWLFLPHDVGLCFSRPLIFTRNCALKRLEFSINSVLKRLKKRTLAALKWSGFSFDFFFAKFAFRWKLCAEDTASWYETQNWLTSAIFGKENPKESCGWVVTFRESAIWSAETMPWLCVVQLFLAPPLLELSFTRKNWASRFWRFSNRSVWLKVIPRLFLDSLLVRRKPKTG